MALERRGNGLYYYKKERHGKRVISTYYGSGLLAECFQILDLERQEDVQLEKENKNRSFEADKTCQDEIDQIIDSFCKNAKMYEDALFLVNGYYKHERQWRRKRNDYDEDEA